MAGRPTKYTRALNDAARDYLVNYSEEYGHPLPSIVGMSVAIGVAKSTLYLWGKDGRGDISDTLAQCWC